MGLEELRIIIIVYISAFLPLILLFALRAKIPSWVPKFYLITFLVCAFGWEIWFNYGLLNGDSVNERRSSVLNEWLPQNINWILNSMADAGTVSLGGLLLVKFLSKKDIDPFQSWRWVHFAVLFTWCIGQTFTLKCFCITIRSQTTKAYHGLLCHHLVKISILCSSSTTTEL